MIKNFNRQNKEKRKQKKNFWQSKIDSLKGKDTTGYTTIKLSNNKIVSPGTTTTATTTAKPTIKAYVPCHSGNIALTRLDKGTLYAGGWTRKADSSNCVTIDLTGTEYRWSSGVCAENTAGETIFKRTLETLSTPKNDNALAWISMPIRDYGTPKWTRATWMTLAIDIFDAMKKDQDVLVACTGGHGRTGMAIAILLSFLGVIPKERNPVEYVRERYCKEAVETSGQENYVYEILELPFTAKASDYSKSYGAYNQACWGEDYDEWDYKGKTQISKFEYCSICKSYKWLTDMVCDDCAGWLEKVEQEEDKKYGLATSVIGTCVYCGAINVPISDYNNDMICTDCFEWNKVRMVELSKKYPDGVNLCSYCGDNIDNPILYYSTDLICEKCYVDLYATGLTSEIVEKDEKRIIVLTDNKNNKIKEANNVPTV